MTDQPKVRIRDLYKIFGAKDKEVLQHVKNGMSKEDLLVKHRHVLGLQDINVDMQAGEITVVMGLSGSGKSTLIRHLNRLIEPTSGEITIDGVDVMAFRARTAQCTSRKDVNGVSEICAAAPPHGFAKRRHGASRPRHGRSNYR